MVHLLVYQLYHYFVYCQVFISSFTLKTLSSVVVVGKASYLLNLINSNRIIIKSFFPVSVDNFIPIIMDNNNDDINEPQPEDKKVPAILEVYIK